MDTIRRYSDTLLCDSSSTNSDTQKRHSHALARVMLGVDVARYGDDRTVLFPRQGLQALRPVIMRHARESPVSTDIATAVLAMQRDLRDLNEWLLKNGDAVS